MKTKLNTKILAALLAVLLFLSCCPMFSFAELFPEDFHIAYEGKKAAQIDIYIHEKKTVTAENLPEGSTYQWQIRIPGTDTWVDIQGQTGQELGISYALVGSLLDREETACVRCAAVTERANKEYTAPLRVILTDEPENVAPTESAVPEITIPVQTEPAQEATEPIPETTEEPDVTEAYEQTVPETTEAPEETAPESTEAPEETISETTEVPEGTAIPEITEVPEETVIPEITEVPEETVIPEITEVPEETAATNATEAADETFAPAEEETVPAEAGLAAEPPEETVPQTEPAPPMLFTMTRSISEEDSTDNGDIMLLAEGEEAVPEFVTVKIQYMRYDYIKNAEGNMVLTDNGQAFNPYIATLLKGSSLNTEVVFPTMVGYDTFVNDSEKSDVSLPISLTDIQNDVTYVVKYMPAQVDYTIRYYFQNIYDDNYVENTDIAAAKYAQGATGSAPDNALVQAVFPGFTSLYYEPELIAADGSTEFEVFYERNYYLMEFDCNEGYGTDTLYVRYGTYISVPQPVRKGYQFEGWDLVKSENPDSPISSGDDVADILPLEMPCYNSAYKAKWGKIQTTYTIIYWAENADNGYYSYWDTASGNAQSANVLIPLEVAAAPANSAASRGLKNAEHFQLNEQMTKASNPETVVVEGDGSTAINVYYSRNVYEIAFRHTGPCQMEHTHTESCYQYFCNVQHQHSQDCYVCGQTEHAHTSGCCSLYHVHEDKCAGNCNHTTHDRNCYSFTGGTVSNTASNNVNPSYHAAKGDVQVYRSGNMYSGYTYYAYIDGKYYRITNYESSNFSGTLNCPHIHSAACYTCSIPVHTHGADEECNLEKCPANGTEHIHTEDCYVCRKAEAAHDTSCCNLEVHAHDGCPTANCTHTVHDITCYTTETGVREATDSDTGFSNVKNNAGSSPQELRIYRYGSGRNNRTYYNYIYLNGAWYYLGTGSGNVKGLQWSGTNPGNGNVTVSGTEVSLKACTHEHSVLCYSCGKTAHAHGDGQCNTDGCENPLHHIHSGSCYLCNINHVHNDACNKSLMCMLEEHTHTTACSGSSLKTIYTIHAKYDANIARIWEEGPIKELLDQGYVWESSDTNNYYSFLEKMPSKSIEMTSEEWSGYKYEWYYYLEVGSYEDTTGLTLREDDGITYKLYHTTTIMADKGTNLTYAEDYFPITGYNQRDNTVPEFEENNNVYTAYLYYRIKDDLEFKYYNYSEEGPHPAPLQLEYNQPLTDIDISREVMERDCYPDGLEPGAYTFAGWYTSQGCYPGSEMKWDSTTMPDGDVAVYAKWVPVTHNVYFHSLYTDIGTTNYWYPKDENGTEIHIQYPIEVEHGALLGTTYNYLPDRSGYTFIGWFYMDADNKKRFAPDSMEIKEDLHLFAEWQSGIDTQYEINYILGEAVTIDGTSYPINTPIAEPTAGHSTAGKTKTFTAKGMGELYEKFRNNMFPTVSSHSVLMDEDKTKNSFNFTYVYDEEVYYKIRYVDYVEGTELIPAKVKLSPNAIVTEKFMPIQGYVPMNFYIRKALISDGDNTSTDDVEQENVITFYYTQDDKHGLYAIEYYQETAVAGEYAKYESIVGSADLFDDKDNPTVINVGDEFKIRSYNGFTYYGYKIITYDTAGNPSTTDSIQTSGDLQGTLTYAGLTIQLYYTRNQYPYTIEYREQGTEKLLKQVSDNSADYQNKFGTEVSHTAVETLTVGSTPYTYYIPHSTEDDRTKSITIRSFQAGEDNPNKLIFYYLPKTVEVLYRVAYRNTSLKDLCHVSMAGEIATTVAGLLGSLAMPGEGFRFVGWYLDEEGNLPVNADWVTTEGGYQKLKPQALDTSMDQVSYYALFEPIDLTVTYDTADGDPISPQTSHIGETFPLPSATRDGYALVSWWLDSDGDGTVDEGEEYKAGTTFTMPGRDVTFVAQWIDYRLADDVKVYVGINMSYYKNGDNLYYNLPDGEPAIIDLSGIRIHNHKQTNGTYHWEIDFTDWDDWLDGVPLDFIKPEIMNPGVLQKNPNQDVWGVYDEDGSDTKALLYFGERNEYTGANGIVEAWLHDIDTLAQKYPSNIDWEALKKMKASDFEVIPYVIKYHRRNTYGEYAWFIDMVIVPVQRYKITYQLNLAPGYTDTAPTDGYEYGQGFIANIANFHDVARGDNPNSIAKFLGWHYDKNGNGKVDAGELLAGSSKLIMPANNVTLTAVWDYPLIISQTGITDSAIYEVVDDHDNVILTVALTGEEQVAVYQLPVGDYTVREKTDWTWKYDSEGSHDVTVTGNGENIVEFTYTGTTPDWLHGETHKENNFAP